MTVAFRPHTRSGSLGVLIFALSLGLAERVSAQTATEGAAASENRTEVVVTGSRIRRDPVEATAPLQTQTAADIERTGEVSLGDFLQRLPISGSAINRSNNASGNLGFPPDGGGIGAGASEIDLRYLTSRRVLVLVDGKRWIRGSSASGVSGAVDLNTIPTDAIDRIEVLQDGASPIYGSDAIAGVVNIITKSEFDGASASVHQGQYGEGDGLTQEYGLTLGGSGEKARAFVSLNYARQDGVWAIDRELSSTPVAFAAPGVGGSAATPQGRFRITHPVTGAVMDLTLDTGATNDIGSLADFNLADPTGGDFHRFTTDDRFNFQPFNYLLTPSRRTNVFGKAEYDLGSDVMLSVIGSYTNRRSDSQAAPNPLGLGSDAGSGALLNNVFIPADHPYNPFGIDLDGTDNLILLARRPLEAGPRIFHQDVDSFLLSTTVDGRQEIAGHPVFWDANFTWGRNSASQLAENIFNSRKLAQGLGPVSQCITVPGCVPINLFGGQGAQGQGSLTPEMLAWATFTQSDQSDQELNDFSLNFSGDLLPLPAGPLGYAIGYEYRKESGTFTPDAAVQAGDTADVPASATAGAIRVNEVYLELRAPLIQERPLFRRVELSAAIRSSDYDTVGRDEVLKGGIYWRLNTDFSLRFNYAEGFRAPNIGELFNTGARFDTQLNDPCSNYLTKDPQTIAGCQALGVPAGFVQINQQISVQTGGNPDLSAERSDTWTVGFGYGPSWASNYEWIDNLTFDFNYYDIRLDSAVQALDAETQLGSCVATLDPLFCSGIVRGGGGSIIAFANQLTNIGRIETDGFDFTATFASRPSEWGALRVSWANTYLNNFTEFTQGIDGFVATERAGTDSASARGFVKWKSTLTTDWELNAFTTSLVVRRLSSLTEPCPQTLVDFGVEDLCSDPEANINKMGSRIFVDGQLSWRPPAFAERLQLGVGVNNLLDKDPPACQGCNLNNLDGSAYPIPGRFYYARANLKL